ncbi:PREDICTED: uncharacterized protein LOC109326358 [Lupinus angustifolius]|uniref:uncharacterized protein LOC109326358 n=1 Tax=Lupinus angustifolius TaxID=3871 RepID=UPI00092E57F0|nr:PREDICTED: uncharacterized protein LOC109326358 [Lupinus angustifolius]
MGQNSGNFLANLPILDEKNWNKWRVQMKALMGYQEVDEIVENGFQPFVEGGTEEQRKLHKENKKKDSWLIHEACNHGAEQFKKVRLQTIRRQYELMQMESNERVTQFFNKVITHTNVMKVCGEKISDQSIIEKILRTLTPRFDQIVVAIEESNKIEEMKVQDLQGSLEPHEQRLIERSNERPIDQALQAHFTDRSGNQKNFQQKNQDKVAHDIKESEIRGSLNQ